MPNHGDSATRRSRDASQAKQVCSTMNCPRAETGMSLVEVLIASTLLGFVMMTTLTTVSYSLSTLRMARNTTRLHEYMNSYVEELRVHPYADIQALAALPQPVNMATAITTESMSAVLPANVTASGNFSTVNVSTPTEMGMIALELTMTWTESSGLVRTKKIYTTFSQNGLSDQYYVGTGF